MPSTAQVQPSPTSTTTAVFTTSTVKLETTTSSFSKATEMTESATRVQIATAVFITSTVKLETTTSSFSKATEMTESATRVQIATAIFTTSTVKLETTTSSFSKATEMTESATGVQIAMTAESLVQKVSLTKQNPTPSIIGTGTPSPNDETSPVAAIIAAVVSFSILTIIASMVIVGLLLMWRKRRSFKPKGLGVRNVLSNSIGKNVLYLTYIITQYSLSPLSSLSLAENAINEVPLSTIPADYEQPNIVNSTTQNGTAYNSHELAGMHHDYDNYTEVEDETLMHSYEGTDEQRATKDKDQVREAGN